MKQVLLHSVSSCSSLTGVLHWLPTHTHLHPTHTTPTPQPHPTHTTSIPHPPIPIHGSQVLAIVPKKDPKRTLRGPEKDLKRTYQAYTSTFYLLYGSWLSKLQQKWWSNSIIVACNCISINWRLWVQPKMVWSPLIATWQVSNSHITIHGTGTKIQLPVCKIILLGAPTLKCCSQMDFKFNGTHNNGKDLLTNTKDPWAESKDL